MHRRRWARQVRSGAGDGRRGRRAQRPYAAGAVFVECLVGEAPPFSRAIAVDSGHAPRALVRDPSRGGGERARTRACSRPRAALPSAAPTRRRRCPADLPGHLSRRRRSGARSRARPREERGGALSRRSLAPCSLPSAPLEPAADWTGGVEHGSDKPARGGLGAVVDLNEVNLAARSSRARSRSPLVVSDADAARSARRQAASPPRPYRRWYRTAPVSTRPVRTPDAHAASPAATPSKRSARGRRSGRSLAELIENALSARQAPRCGIHLSVDPRR